MGALVRVIKMSAPLLRSLSFAPMVEQSFVWRWRQGVALQSRSFPQSRALSDAGHLSKSRIKVLPSTSPFKDFVDVVTRDGAVIIKDFMTPEEIDAMNADALPLLAGKTPTFDLQNADSESATLATTTDSFEEDDYSDPYPPEMTPTNTTHLWGLLGRLPTHVTTIMRKPLWQGLMKRFLSGWNRQKFGDQEIRKRTGYMLSLAAAFQIGPGANAQVLHRDQGFHSVQIEDHDHDIFTSMCGFLIAGSKSTEKNGATRILLGSHLESQYDEREEQYPNVPAEMEKGSALFWLGSTLHGAGANVTAAGDEDCTRLLYGVFACCDYFRQEENQILVTPREVAEELPIDILKLAGWAPGVNGAGFAFDCDDPAILRIQTAEASAKIRPSDS